MKNRFFLSLVHVCVTVLLGACASSAKLLPNGNYFVATTVGDSWDRSSTSVGEYQCPVDKETSQPIIGKCKLAENAAPPDRVHGQTVAGQVAVGAMGGTGAAIVNGNTARAVAEKGKCPAGSVCNGTVINNQVKAESVAKAINMATLKMESPCANTNTCGH